MRLMFNNFFPTENRAVHEKMWKKTVTSDRPQMIIWRMRIACWIPKSANTHSEYAILCFSTATMVARTVFSFRYELKLYV